MPRLCRACGAPYLGDSRCSRVGCARNGRRQRDLFPGPAEEVPRIGPDPAASQDQPEPDVPAEPVPPAAAADPTRDRDLAELRGLLHEVLEMACLIAQRWGVAALYPEVPTLERVVRVFGGRHIRWPHGR